MKNHNYPIVLGHQYKKGVMALKHGEHGFRFLICRLRKEYQTGTEFELDDIENIEQEIWFSDRQTLETVIGVMEKVLQRW